MDVISKQFPVVIAALVITLVAFFFANRSKLKPLFVIIAGATSIFTLCFLMWNGASLSELAITLLAFFVLGYAFNGKRRNKTK